MSVGASKAILGLVEGFVATIPMSAAMVVQRRLLPRRQRYALPPKQIVAQTAEKLDGPRSLVRPSPQRNAITWVAHFTYGAAGGAAYELFFTTRDKERIRTGIKFGLIVWAAGYLGWLPAFDYRASATREPLPRVGLMIVAHVVWGAALSVAHKVARASVRSVAR